MDEVRSTAPGTRRFRIDLAYDGSDFAGWAAQPGQRTVQAELAVVLSHRPPAPGTAGRLVVAGRTDAGVHARGQVFHVDVTPPSGTVSATGTVSPSGHVPHTGGASASGGAPATTDVDRWLPDRVVRSWNAMLPPDVRIRALAEAPDGFDARFSALWRRYVYRLSDGDTVPDPLLRTWTTPHLRVLDPAAMTRAGARLTGRRDFAAFCRRRPGATTIRTLQTLAVTRGVGGVVAIEVVADAFCHSMVRALVGALLPVGDGRRGEQWPAALLAAGVRDARAAVAPARGLALEEVGYPPPPELAARAARTRALRQAHDVEAHDVEAGDVEAGDVEIPGVEAGGGEDDG